MVAFLTVELAERAAAHGRIAIDTEFVSERRYQALLCLAQVAVPDPDAPDGVRTEVVDPLGDDPPDPAPLARVLADPNVEVVMHAGRQDIAILRRTWNTDITRVFDTQIGAGFIGFGNQEGYESLVRKVLGVKLKGSEGFTKWDRRPLTAQQLEYAGDDARLLLGLGEEIERQLNERGRLSWALEECRVLEASSDERDPDRVYDRLPRLSRLGDAARAMARELVEWREQQASSVDRPPSYVLPDQALIELARRAPSDRNGLEQIRGLPAQTMHRRGDSLLQAIDRGRNRPAPPAPPEPGPREPADAPLVSLAQALVRHRSMEEGVAVELIATQSELSALVSALRRGDDGDHVRVAHGWRGELVGDELRELVAGRRALSVNPDGGLRVNEVP
ncbi:MAG: ribonuclease [Solirubrobacterales bacterium]|jgi:ribonuclease D|nr:ribonuclease [Solirubrobacterales bacterium]MEA2330316.1 ribonuclease [Thermoleophilaceae bacterium]